MHRLPPYGCSAQVDEQGPDDDKLLQRLIVHLGPGFHLKMVGCSQLVVPIMAPQQYLCTMFLQEHCAERQCPAPIGRQVGAWHSPGLSSCALPQSQTGDKTVQGMDP
jgi:hypothetical protein